MQEYMSQGHLYLSGGGNDDQSFPLDILFFKEIPTEGKFFYVPIALRGHRLYPGAADWMKGIVKKHGREDIVFDTADDLSIVTRNDLAGYNAIYIGGGNTWLLMQEMRESGFDKLLDEYIHSGGVVYGGSAGAIVLGKRVDTHDDANEVGVSDMDGMDVLSGYSVACHFKSEQEDRFAAWAETNRLPILCLPEDAGIAVVAGVATCIGSACALFAPGGVRREIAPGESLPLI